MKQKNKSTRPIDKCELFVPPPLDDFINRRWWTVLEAAFVLTGWPEYELFLTNISQREFIPVDILEDRPYFILPSRLPIDLEHYSKEFAKLFHEINEDVNNKKLRGRHFFIAEGIYNLVNPCEALLWAIKKRLILPLDLQTALSIKQMKQRQVEPWQKKVKVMIVGQYYKLSHPKATKEEIIDCPWMKKYAKKIENENQARQLRNDFTTVSKKGVPGRPKKVSDEDHPIYQEPLKVIPQVLKRCGLSFACDFALLDTVISTAVSLKSFEVVGKERLLEMNLEDFLSLMKSDKIIRLYLKGVPQIIEQFIEAIIRKVFGKISDCFHWENLFKTMPKQWSVKLN